MSIKALFSARAHGLFVDITLLALRCVTGLAFVFHGWGKIQSPMNWMGPEAAVPGIFQALAAISEFGGGAAWIVGLVFPLASFGMFCTMVVATLFHAVLKGDPFVAMGGPSYELALVYLCVSFLFLATGPGRISLDSVVFGVKK